VETKYITGIKHTSLIFMYDPLLRWALRETAIKRQLIEQAQIEKGHRVLDLGCGPATLTLLIRRAHPEADVIGFDGAQKAIDLARAKAAKAALKVTLDHVRSFDLPYPDDSFDRVVSSLVFHHWTRENKARTLKEAFRVLRPGGELHVTDWGEPQNTLMRVAVLSVQLLDGFKSTTDNVNGVLPKLFGDAGFEEVQESARYMTPFGTLSLYRACKRG
jgi:ubiquinone/menaquinone biosynthesis C-methylase UbiE